MAQHGSAVLHTDCVYDDGVLEHTVVDAGPFRTTTTCTDLLPRYYGYVCIPCRRFCCAVHVTCTVARTHARTNVQTSLAPVSCPAGHESRVQTSRWREACRSPVSQLRCMCCAVAVRVLLSILSVPTSGLPVPCLPVCLPACPPGRLARARHKNHHLPPSRHIV